jgi:hypothetical protein
VEATPLVAGEHVQPAVTGHDPDLERDVAARFGAHPALDDRPHIVRRTHQIDHAPSTAVRLGRGEPDEGEHREDDDARTK